MQHLQVVQIAYLEIIGPFKLFHTIANCMLPFPKDIKEKQKYLI